MAYPLSDEALAWQRKARAFADQELLPFEETAEFNEGELPPDVYARHRRIALELGIPLMDAPLANLDPPHQTDWLLTAKSLVASGKTVISVLHEISFALQADDVVVMAAGRVTHQGACRDVASHRAIEAVFEQRIAIHQLAGQWVALPNI
jgi:ABC-type hemin transport system ATPase subunit